MKKKDLLRPCPVCQNAVNGDILHTQKFVLADGHILPNMYDLVACSKCGFVYADTSAGQDIYDKYYAKLSNYESAHVNIDSTLYADRAAWIETLISNKNASIIDVGCGNGELLFELHKLGFSDLTALDPSQKCIDGIRSRGMKGITSSIFDVSINDRYDCVILSGVLEHISDVFNFMRRMKLLIKSDGFLFICVPDASRYRDYDVVPYDYFNIEHINHFEETSLINLGLFHGLRIFSLLKTLHKVSAVTDNTISQVKQPIMFCMFKNEDKETANWQNYSKINIKKYIAKTHGNIKANLLIAELIQRNEEIIVWGAGSYTSRLFATADLGKCNIAMFVDNDLHKQGMSFAGKTVYPPSAILTMDKKSTILVSASVLHDEILSKIKNMGLDNKVVLLNE